MNECECGARFPTKLAPCPDGRVGCCVAHYDKDSYTCPSCGKDYGPGIMKALMDGNVTESIGIAVINMAAAARLEFYDKSDVSIHNSTELKTRKFY